MVAFHFVWISCAIILSMSMGCLNWLSRIRGHFASCGQRRRWWWWSAITNVTRMHSNQFIFVTLNEFVGLLISFQYSRTVYNQFEMVGKHATLLLSWSQLLSVYVTSFFFFYLFLSGVDCSNCAFRKQKFFVFTQPTSTLSVLCADASQNSRHQFRIFLTSSHQSKMCSITMLRHVIIMNAYALTIVQLNN